MPELPEVETTRRGIAPFLLNQHISKIQVHQRQLRWPIPPIEKPLKGQKIHSIQRRAKYLLIELDSGFLIIHLGMSGRLLITNLKDALPKHSHVEIIFRKHKLLYIDPRRFGAVLFTNNLNEHRLLSHLGPEPLSRQFTSNYIYPIAQTKSISLKSFIMDQKYVVGVGNIYASEALFLAKLSPFMQCNQLSKQNWGSLVNAIKEVLKAAIKQGGTSLKDFKSPDGKAGYFKVALNVYGKENDSCTNCGDLIKKETHKGRATYFCRNCQDI